MELPLGVWAEVGLDARLRLRYDLHWSRRIGNKRRGYVGLLITEYKMTINTPIR